MLSDVFPASSPEAFHPETGHLPPLIGLCAASDNLDGSSVHLCEETDPDVLMQVCLVQVKHGGGRVMMRDCRIKPCFHPQICKKVQFTMTSMGSN